MCLRTSLVLLVIAAAATGCGGSSDDGRTDQVSPAKRIERCISEYPDSTKRDCTKWEDDGQLEDSGMHADHEGM